MAHKFDFDHVYTIDKPLYKQTDGYDKWYMFEVAERNGNDIVFANRNKRVSDKYLGRVLVNPNTGDEICFISCDGMRLKLDARDSFGKGKRISKETLKMSVGSEWDEATGKFIKTDECGMTIEEFLKKKAAMKSKH